MRLFRSAGPLFALLLVLGSGAALAQAAASPELEEGLRLLKERRYEDALKKLTRAAELTPDQPEAWTGLGNVNLAMQRHKEAVAAFERALGLTPDAHTVRYNLAFALRKAGRPRDAAEAYRRYLEKQPDDPDAYYGLAESLRELKDALGAAEAYEAYAQREDRPDRQSWVEKAEKQAAALRAYAGQGEAPRKHSAATPAAATTPATTPATEKASTAERTESGASPMLGQARAELQAGRFALALERLEALAEPERRSMHAAAAFAAAHLGLGEAEAAVGWYRSALAMAPEPAKTPLLFGLAEALRRDGDRDGAMEALKAVIQRGDSELVPAAEERLRALEAG